MIATEENMKRIEDVLSEFRNLYGDRFDYSEFSYLGQHRHSTIICKEHGAFLATFHTHRRDNGACPGCRYDSRRDSFVSRLRNAFGDRFSFEKMSYVDSDTPVVLTCAHGDFLVTPSNIAKTGNAGCRFCIGEIKRKGHGERVVPRFRKVHGDNYDYSKFEYGHMHQSSTIVCPKHGDFEMSPANHLAGHGCWRCSSGAPSSQENAWITSIEDEMGLRADRSIGAKTRSRGKSMIDAVFGNVAVEFDGCYWHSMPGSAEKDESKNRALAEAGYKVIRLRAYSSRYSCPEVSGSINFRVPERVDPTIVKNVVRTIREEMK